MPSGLPDASRLAYVLETLLNPLGLGVECQPAAVAADGVRLAWRDRPGAGGVDVDLPRLRQAFEAISGQREFAVPRDRLGRVQASALGVDCSRPVWSEWAREWATALAARNPEWRPAASRLTVHLSHDVDRVSSLEPLGLMGRFLRSVRGALGGDTQQARALAGWLKHAGRFLETYETVMRVERDAGAVATYFFMSGPYSLRPYGSRGGSGRRLRRMVERVHDYGHRVGLHGDVRSLQWEDYGRQRAALERAAGRPVTWHRNHYLIYEAARSAGLLAAAGLAVDSTCGFHDANGFRAGLAHPYRLWDWGADRPSAVTEIPLVFMDRVYRGPIDEEWAQARRNLEAAAAVAGEVALLVHVDRFLESREVLDRYVRLLEWLKGRRAALRGDVASSAAALP